MNSYSVPISIVILYVYIFNCRQHIKEGLVFVVGLLLSAGI